MQDGLDKSTRSAIKIGKIIKLSKLLRIGRIVKYLRNYFKYRHLLIFTFFLGFYVHWATCLLFLLEVETTASTRESDILALGTASSVFSLYISLGTETLMMFTGDYSAILSRPMSDAINAYLGFRAIFDSVLQAALVAVLVLTTSRTLCRCQS